MSTIAVNLRYFMNLKRMTARQLAERAGVSTSYIAFVLSGDKSVGVKSTERLASALGIAPMTLRTGITPDHLDPVDQEIGQRELVKEDPRAFATMMNVIKKASK